MPDIEYFNKDHAGNMVHKGLSTRIIQDHQEPVFNHFHEEHDLFVKQWCRDLFFYFEILKESSIMFCHMEALITLLALPPTMQVHSKNQSPTHTAPALPVKYGAPETSILYVVLKACNLIYFP